LLLAGFVVIALALRLRLFGDSLFADEIGTNYDLYGFGTGSLLHIVEGDTEGTPPLFFLRTSLTKGIGGVEGYRVISLLAGLASIPLVYLLGLRTTTRRAATVAAALMVISPFQIFYSTEARGYELVMFWTLLATFSAVAAFDSGRVRWWVVYAVSIAAAMYTHYTAAFVLLALFLWSLLAYPKRWREPILATAGGALLFALAAPAVRRQQRSVGKAHRDPHPVQLSGGSPPAHFGRSAARTSSSTRFPARWGCG
jgi:hypothetical protein